MAELKYVDLFAGCGGFSLGVERAGFELVAAVEKSAMPAQTFYHNFIDGSLSDDDWKEYLEKDILDQFEAKVIPRTVREVLDNSSIMESIRDTNIDLVIGGPPCQGFSTAGRRNHGDPRNQLAWEFLEFVEKTSPKVVVIENVLGMNRKFPGESKTAFEMYSDALAETGDGYVVQKNIANAMHFGAAQSRPRVMIIGVRKDIAAKNDITAGSGIWKSAFSDETTGAPALSPVPVIPAAGVRTVADVLVDLQDASRFKATDSSASAAILGDLKDASLWNLKPVQDIPNLVLPNHTDKVVLRLRVKQYLRSAGARDDFLFRLAEGAAVDWSSLPFPAMSPDGEVIAKDLAEFKVIAHQIKTKKRTQRVMDLNLPSRTILTLPEDYIHPTEPRIFTVREMARFQGFPDAFTFRGKLMTGGLSRRTETPQYSQVGNAVSPFLGYAVGLMASAALN